jgi:hypothetical protein
VNRQTSVRIWVGRTLAASSGNKAAAHKTLDLRPFTTPRDSEQRRLGCQIASPRASACAIQAAMLAARAAHFDQPRSGDLVEPGHHALIVSNAVDLGEAARVRLLQNVLGYGRAVDASPQEVEEAAVVLREDAIASLMCSSPGEACHTLHRRSVADDPSHPSTRKFRIMPMSSCSRLWQW